MVKGRSRRQRARTLASVLVLMLAAGCAGPAAATSVVQDAAPAVEQGAAPAAGPGAASARNPLSARLEAEGFTVLFAPQDSLRAELVRAARSGDARAMETLLERHFTMVRAVCHRIAGAHRDGDDATQEAMIRIVRSLDRFDGRSAFSTWAYRVASNAALDELRRRSRRPMLHVVDDDDDRNEPPDDLAERTITATADREALQQALRQIPEEFRVPVVLRDVADFDYDEIAESLGIPIGTVKSRIARGRRQLAALLGNHEPTDRRPTAGTDR